MLAWVLWTVLSLHSASDSQIRLPPKVLAQLAYAPVDYNYMETLTKTYIIPVRENQSIQENIFNNAPIRRIAIAMNSNSAFTGCFAENPF